MILLYAYLSSLSTNISQTAHTSVSLLTCKMCYAVFASKNRAFDKSNFVCCRFLAETNSKTDLPIKRRFRYFQHSTQKRFTTSSKTEKAYGVPLQSKNRTAHFYTCLYHRSKQCICVPKIQRAHLLTTKGGKVRKKGLPRKTILEKISLSVYDILSSEWKIRIVVRGQFDKPIRGNNAILSQRLQSRIRRVLGNGDF